MDILEFQGEYRWLSNFWPCEVRYEGVTYPTVENAFQAAKFEKSLRENFVVCTPVQAKQLGRQFPMRKDWMMIRRQVMRWLIEQKFATGTELAKKLVATHPGILVEGNRWGDHFWGVCNGIGDNHLGKLLMEQRATLIASM